MGSMSVSFLANYSSTLATKSPWPTNSLVGRVVRFYDNTANDTDESTGFLFEGVVYANTINAGPSASIHFRFPEDPRAAGTGFNSGTVTPKKISIKIEFHFQNRIQCFKSITGIPRITRFCGSQKTVLGEIRAMQVKV